MANDRDPAENDDTFDDDTPEETEIREINHAENDDPNIPADQPPTVDLKEDKADKKRMEKETKEREKAEKDAEKKRKEEEKRQLKEQEKKLKDAAKEEKKGTASRKQEREEKYKEKKGAAAFFSPLRPGVRPKNAVRGRVLLLDGSEIEVDIEKEAKAQILVDKVCEYVNVLERDYFSCMHNDEKTEKFWLIHDRKLAKQIGNSTWTFEFCLKYYPPEPSIFTEDLTRYLLCLQLRADILIGKLPCSPVASAVLGSYTVQSELGDYDVTEHGKGIEYLQDIPFSPNQTDELLEKIAELHRSDRCRGRTPAEAELTYLENAKKLDLYGVHLCPCKDSEFFDIFVGVSATGIHVYRDRLKVNRFPWPKVLKMSYKHKTFYIKIRPGEFERFENTIGFKMDSHLRAKRFWRLAIEHHTFFRLKEPIRLNESMFSRFGSTKSRFSGRTHYQSRVFSNSVSRIQPSFERSFSSRSLASRSFANNSFVDRDEKRRSATLDSRTARRAPDDYYHDEYSNADERQIAVVAGTAPDASRVAYVKTVRPEAATNEPEQGSTWRSDTRDHYSNLEDDQFNNRDQYSPESMRTDDMGYPTVPVDSPTEGGSLLRSNSGSGAEPRMRKKKKKKKSTSSARSSEMTEVGEDGAVYTDRVAQVERRTDNRINRHADDVFGEEVDHDFELSKAIYSVTDVNTDMSVERIQINPSDVAKSMTGAGSEENFEIAPHPKKTKKKSSSSKREKVPA